jgi:hypothetical protein
MKRARKAGLCAGVSVLILTSCGGGSDSSDATAVSSSQPATDSTPETSPTTTIVVSTTESATTTADPTTTTIAAATTTLDPRPIDPEDEALAVAATQQAASFAAPWTVFSEGAPDPVSTESCSYRPDGALTLLTNGASQGGPTMQLGDTGAFVSSSGQAFPDETLAMEYVGVLNTDDWAACRVEKLQKFQQDNNSTSVVELATRESDSLNQDGFESYAEFHVKSADGTLQRVVMQSFYRLGRTVISQAIEYGALSDSDLDKLVNDAYIALSDSYNRVNALP